MGILSGGLSLKRFLVLGPVPDEEQRNEALRQDQFRPFEDGLEEERMGWCDWRNPLICPPDPDWVDRGEFLMLGLRIDTRKVPPVLLKAHLDLKTQSLMKEKDLAFIGKEARTSLQDEIKVELLRKVLPSPKIIEIAWDTKQGILWTTATSSKAQGALTGLFMKSFGVELQPMAPLILAGRVVPDVPTEVLLALDPMNFETEAAEV